MGGLALTRPPIADLTLREAHRDEFLPAVSTWVRLAGVVLLGSFIGSIGLMAVWPYRVVVRGTGLVRPRGETRVISAPFAARVRQVLVQPNQRVQAGQVLAVLDRADLQGKQQQLRQDSQALVLQTQAQQRQAVAALKASESEVDKSEAAVRFAKAEYERFQKLAGSGAITLSQQQEKLENFNVARANLAKARQVVLEQRSHSLSDLAQLQKELARNRADAGQISRDLAKTAITAPVSGVLFSLQLRNPGQMVAAGAELASIAPTEVNLLVKVRVSSEDISNVQVGQQADLRIASCPYPDYGTLKSTVASIAPEAGAQDLDRVHSPERQESAGFYEVTLQPRQTKLWARTGSCPLRQGMDVTADIVTRNDTVLRFLLRKARLTTGV